MLLGFPFLKSQLLQVRWPGPLSLLRAIIIGLFLCASRDARVWLGRTFAMDLTVLRTNSFVRRTNSINLEKEENDRFSKNILRSLAIL